MVLSIAFTGQGTGGGRRGGLDEEERDANGVFVMQLLRSVKSCHSLMHLLVGDVIIYRIKPFHHMKTRAAC